VTDIQNVFHHGQLGRGIRLLVMNLIPLDPHTHILVERLDYDEHTLLIVSQQGKVGKIVCNGHLLVIANLF
jgi:hypothetical protein